MSDARSGEFIDESGPAMGKTEHDDYTLLIIIHFTRTDLEEHRWDLGPYYMAQH